MPLNACFAYYYFMPLHKVKSAYMLLYALLFSKARRILPKMWFILPIILNQLVAQCLLDFGLLHSRLILKLVYFYSQMH